MTNTIIFYSIDGSTKTMLVIISMLGFVVFDIVYTTVVMNYAAQSEMNIFLLRTIRNLIMQKKYADIESSIKV